MLSAESAAGKYPIEAVTTMNNVALSVEKDPTYRQVIEASRVVRRETIADGIVSAAREIAEATNIKAIACFSQSGQTVSLVARERPRVPIIALTPLMSTARRLALTWGAHCVITEPQDRFKGAVISAVKAARADGFAEEEDMIVVTAGVPFNVKGTTNILRVAPCDERLISKVDPE
jgi:pyruvate kinase